jgi:hypothetical protein
VLHNTEKEEREWERESSRVQVIDEGIYTFDYLSMQHIQPPRVFLWNLYIYILTSSNGK